MSKADVSTTPILSRRAALTGLALLPATAAGAAAAVDPDPIFAALDAFYRADAVYMAWEGDEDGLGKLGDIQSEAYGVVLGTRPTTPAGLVALTGFARERSEWLLANASVRSDEDEREVFAAIDDAAKALIGRAA
jgi:hypothetical protein